MTFYKKIGHQIKIKVIIAISFAHKLVGHKSQNKKRKQKTWWPPHDTNLHTNANLF